MICPFLALTVLVACVPPGYLWAEEGNGYDVLEYHLEMPKEYLQAGRVQYAPHNVYANFPANVEMLYLLCMILRGDAIQAAVACKLLNAGLAVLTVAAAWMVGRRRGPGTATVTAVIAAGVGWLIYLSGVAFVENGMLLFGMLSVSALNDGLDQSASRRRWYTLAGLLAGFSLGCKYTAGALIGLPLTVALLFCSQMPLRRRLIGAGLFAAAQAVAFMPWAAKNTAMTGNPVFPLANSVFAAHPPGWGPAESSHFDASHAAASNERSLGARLAALWRHIPADPDQRFGAVLLVFAAWAALTLRRDDTIRLCGVILLIQLPIWLFTTHLYARFAVPLLIPLILMAGRVPLAGTRRKGAIVGMLIIGTAINLAFFAALYLRHMAPQGQRFAIEGVPEYFTEGAAAGFEYLEVVNKDLPTDARILLIGDAKAFYFRRQVDYCVVFNRSPFVQQVRAGATPAAILQWLADRGYTHVLVNWAEIRRLARSAYGFPEEITPDLFGRLTTAGLETVCTVDSHTTGRPYADLYRVAAPPG